MSDKPDVFYVPMLVRPWSGLQIGDWRPKGVENGGYGFLCAFTTREEAEQAYPMAKVAEFRYTGEGVDGKEPDA